MLSLFVKLAVEVEMAIHITAGQCRWRPVRYMSREDARSDIVAVQTHLL